MLKTFGFILFWAAMNCAVATTNILTFDAYSRAGTDSIAVALHPEEDGFIFSSPIDSGYSVWGTESAQYRGSTAIFHRSGTGGILARTNAGTFDFLGAGIAGTAPSPTGSVTFTGYRGLNPVVEETVFIPLGANFQTFTPTGFTNLTEMRWAGRRIQLDDVTLVTRGEQPSGPVIHNFWLNSIAQCDLSQMRIGRTYTFQASSNLTDWIPVRSWKALSTIDQASAMRFNTTRFHRLVETTR